MISSNAKQRAAAGAWDCDIGLMVDQSIGLIPEMFWAPGERWYSLPPKKANMWTLIKSFLLRSQKKTFYWFSNQNFHIDKYEKYPEKIHWEHKAGDNAHLFLFSLSLNLFLSPNHWYHSKVHHIRESRALKFYSSCETCKYILKFKQKYLITI